MFIYSLKVNDCGEGSKDIGRSRGSFLLFSGAVLDAFGKHFGSLGGVLDDTGASLSLLGGSWGRLGRSCGDLGATF